MADVAFLGLGKMGSGMAACLAKVGHTVTVWNRSPEKAHSLAGIARVATSPSEASRTADAIFSMVADDAASERVWLAQDGAFSTARKGALAIESSTISHAHATRLAAEATKRGLGYIDCPVNGAPSAAARWKADPTRWCQARRLDQGETLSERNFFIGLAFRRSRNRHRFQVDQQPHGRCAHILARRSGRVGRATWSQSRDLDYRNRQQPVCELSR